MQQIQLVDQAVLLEKLQRAINRNTSNIRIDLLRQLQYFPGVKMLRCAFDYLQDNAALPSETNSTKSELSLQPARRFVLIDSFARGNPVRRCSCHRRIIPNEFDRQGNPKRSVALDEF